MALYFFSGKGGVGKTHLSTSFAHFLASSGRKVLLVEFSDSAQYSQYFSAPVSFEPIKFEDNLFLATWSGEDCLQEYVAKVLRSKAASDFFMKMPIMKKLIHAAPGLKEIAVLGKMTSDYRDLGFETGFQDIVFDAPSSGHFVSLLSVPESLGRIVGVGPMKRQCSEIQTCLEKNSEVYIALVDDGSKFAQKESAQTKEKIQEVLKGKRLHALHNYQKGLGYIKASTWLEAARDSQTQNFWKEFKWAP